MTSVTTPPMAMPSPLLSVFRTRRPPLTSESATATGSASSDHRGRLTPHASKAVPRSVQRSLWCPGRDQLHHVASELGLVASNRQFLGIALRGSEAAELERLHAC